MLYNMAGNLIESELNITYWKWVQKIVLFLDLCELFFLRSFFLICSNYYLYSGVLLLLLLNAFLCFLVWTCSKFKANNEHLQFKSKKKPKVWVVQFWKQYQVRNRGGYFTLSNSPFSKIRNKSKLHRAWFVKKPQSLILVKLFVLVRLLVIFCPEILALCKKYMSNGQLCSPGPWPVASTDLSCRHALAFY